MFSRREYSARGSIRRNSLDIRFSLGEYYGEIALM
jgi:hypothetical protein